MFAIYRHEKIGTLGELAASASHMMRTRPTPNADPARRSQNQVLIGSDDPAADVQRLLPALGERRGGRVLRRRNSVLAIEVLLTASPAWWAQASPAQQRAWVRRSVEWIERTYGRANIAHLQLHQDERTPHLTGFVVPLDPITGALNARRWIGGRAACAALQTSYAAAVADLGLRRGVEGSTARHERVRRHYAQIAQPVATVAVPPPPRICLDPQAWAAEATRQARRQVAPLAARARVVDSERSLRQRAEAQAAADRARAERARAEAEAARAEARALADSVRALPLDEVLEALGGARDPHDREKWRIGEFIITIKEQKWFDHAAGRGRGGAIDLVAHVLGCDPRGAISWLADRFGAARAASDLAALARARAAREVAKAVEAGPPPFSPPPPAPAHWPAVRRYLVEERALPADAVDTLHARGDVYADARANAVFVARDATGRPVGAELKGTRPRPDGSRFAGLAPGSRRDAGGFTVGRWLGARVVYLVEAAIDAISLFARLWRQGERGAVVVSTAGARPTPAAFLEALAANLRRVCAYDADAAGDRAAEALAAAGWERLRPPPPHKDWNEEAQAQAARASPAPAASTTDDGPTSSFPVA